jgi:hypothetical protein
MSFIIGSGSGAASSQFERGIKFANVPGGDSKNVSSFGSRIYHINRIENVVQQSSDKSGLSGVIRFRGSVRKSTPASVQGYDVRSVDRWKNPVFPFTGKYPPGFPPSTFCDGVWSSGSQLSFPRSRYVTYVTTDERIVVAGGLGSGSVPLSGAEIYSTGTQSWVVLPDMPSPKSQAAGVVLDDGRLMIVGGSGSVSASTSSFAYSLASGTWTSLSSTIVGRKDFHVIKLTDGRVFAPGGTGLSGSTPFTGSEMYSTSSGKWYADSTTLPPIPLYPYDREGYSLDLLDDGSVLMVGGKDPIDSRIYPHVFRFYPNDTSVPGSTGSWTVEPSMSFPRSNHATVKLPDGKILILGGFVNAGVPNLQSFLQMQLGGEYDASGVTAEVEMYDPVAGSVSHAGIMWRPRARFTANMMPKYTDESRVMVLGGVASGVPVSSSEIFDIEFGTFTEVLPMPNPVYAHACVQISRPTDRFPYVFLVPSGERSGTLSPYLQNQTYDVDCS